MVVRLQVADAGKAAGLSDAQAAALSSVVEARQSAVKAANVVNVAGLSKLSLKDFDWSVRVRAAVSCDRPPSFPAAVLVRSSCCSLP